MSDCEHKFDTLWQADGTGMVICLYCGEVLEWIMPATASATGQTIWTEVRYD